MSYKYVREFRQFVKDMKIGLRHGQEKYGDEGLFGDSQLEMIEEELRDVACYSYLLYLKIQMLKKRMVKITDLKEITGKGSKNAFRRVKK